MNKTAVGLAQKFEALGKNAPVYDFRIPKKFTKSDMKALNRVTDSFSKLLTLGLTSMTRENCSVYNPRLEEVSCSEYLDSMPKFTMIGLLSMNFPQLDLRDPRVMFHMPPEFSFFMIDILLGGSGSEYNLSRQHTDIEVAILRNLITRFSDIMADAWSSITQADFHYEKSETNPKLIDVKSDSEIKMVMTFDVSVKNMMTSISMAFSAHVLEDMMSKLNSTTQVEDSFEPVDSERDNRRRSQILDSLNETSIELKAVLAEMTVDMQDIAALKKGDIIPLEKKITEDITIKVDDIPWFKAKLGRLNIKKAVKITEVIHDNNG